MLFVYGGAHALPSIDGAVVRSAKKTLLKRTEFQKTDTDLSFAENMKVMADGYEAYYTEYDASGRCVKNCTYPGITLSQERELKRLATNLFARDLCVGNGENESTCNARYCGDSGCDVVAYANRVKDEADSTEGSAARSAVVPRVANVRRERSGNGYKPIVVWPNNVFEQQDSMDAGSLVWDDSVVIDWETGPVTRRILANVLDAPLVVISAGGERVANGSAYHAGVDFMAGYKQKIYAPRDGVVRHYLPKHGAAGNTLMLFHAFRGGNEMQHAGSADPDYKGATYHYFTRYMHLSGVATGVTTKGQTVTQGQVIAYVGNTGGRYGMHLHYEFGVYIDFPNVSDSGDMKISIDLLGTDTNWAVLNDKYKYKNTKYSDAADVFKNYNMLGGVYWMRYSASNKSKSISNPLFQKCVDLNKSNLKKMAKCMATYFVGCQGILNCVDYNCTKTQEIDAYAK